MIRDREGSNGEEEVESKVFVGVRFVLLGFSPVDEDKVRCKLVNGGGIDVGECSAGYTHVIVDKVVYDDPVCIVARKDGKQVITALWVDHSFDVGMPVDTTSVLYRPVRDFNGIPGAKLFSICLTGYQRQDRDDIMRMVGLMGAFFSKPLVANKVTHLICYKFEGEKYELAKKLKKIKLVNHRWLEDSLRAWEILPECNYTKSGYELEIMEAEAKDSEEETEEHGDPDKLRVRMTAGEPSNLQSGSGIPISEGFDLKFPVARQELPTMLKNATEYTSLPDVAQEIATNHGLGRSPRKGNELSNLHGKNMEDSGMLSCQGTEDKCRNGMSSGLLSSSNRSPTFDRKTGGLISNALPAKMSPFSKVGELSNTTYARRTPVRSPASMLSKTLSSHAQGSPIGPLGECKFPSFDISPPRVEQVNNFDLETVQPLRNELELGSDSGKSYTLPQKRKAALSVSTPELPKKSEGSTVEAKASLSAVIRPENLLMGAHKMTSSSIFNSNDWSDLVDGMKSALNQAAELPKTVSIPNTLLEQGHSVKGIFNRNEFPLNASMLDARKERTPEVFLGTKGESGLNVEHVVKDAGSLEDAPATKGGELQKSNGNVLQPNKTNIETVPVTQTNEASAKSLTKKTSAKKSLGARTKLSARDTSKQKGSLPFDNLASASEATMCSLRGKVGGGGEEELRNMSEMVGRTSGLGSICEGKTPKDLSSENKFEDKEASMNDDETEAPEDASTEPEKAGSEGKGELDIEACNVLVANLEVEHAKKIINKEPATGKQHLLTRTEGDASHVLKGTAKARKANELEIEANNSYETTEVEAANGVQRPAFQSNDMASSVNHTLIPNMAAKSKSTGNLHKAKQGRGRSNKSQKSSASVMKEIEESGNETNGLEMNNNPINGNVSIESAKVTQCLPDELKKTEMTLDAKEKAASDEVEEGALQNQDMLKKSKNIQHKTSRKNMDGSKFRSKTNDKLVEVKAGSQVRKGKPSGKLLAVNEVDKVMDEEKENKQTENIDPIESSSKRKREVGQSIRKPMRITNLTCETTSAGVSDENSNSSMPEPHWFIMSGHRLQRKEFQQVIRRLKGRVCRDSHNWSYQATHFIVPDPVKRTEKFFAAAASGRWILRTDYLTASNQAGKFLAEEPYEWYKNGLSEDGAINLEAPRKWRLLRERTGHGALYGLRVVIYGDCISPPLDTLKRAVKAGDGTILATSPPYTRFLESGVDFAVVSPSTMRVDPWVQEFIRHEIPCVVADYLVEYVCKPGYSLERHVLYNTHAWAEKSFASLQSQAEEIIEASSPSSHDNVADIACQVCGALDRPEVMLICGDESGSLGCGIGTHIDCCDPPLQAVPEEDWFCTKCSKRRSITNPPSKPTKRRSSSLKCR